MVNKGFSFFLFLLFCLPLAAQQTYHARVVDAETGEALPYASITSDSHVAMSNDEGAFAIEGRDDQIITISAIGYNTTTVKSGEAGTTIYLQPLKEIKSDTTGTVAEALLHKLLKKMIREYQKHAKTKSAYYIRQTSNYYQWRETIEAFQLSESALNIGNTERTGETIYRVDHHEYNMRLPYSDLQHLTELGASTVESSFWRYTEKPFRVKTIPQISSYDPFPSSGTISGGTPLRPHSSIDKLNFNYSSEMLQDIQGNEIAKVYMWKKDDFWSSESILKLLMNSDEIILFDGKNRQRVRINEKEKKKLMKLIDFNSYKSLSSVFIRRNGTEVNMLDAMEPDAFPIIDGVAWIDVEKNQLLAVRGTLYNFSLGFGCQGMRRKAMADVKFDITYTHQNKFTEVENIALWVKADSLISKTLLCNLHLNSKAKRGRIFKESRESATPESLNDMPRPILRTALEERIVAEAKEEHKEQ